MRERIPTNLQNTVEDITETVLERPFTIKGRDDIIKEIWRCFLKKQRRGVILIGKVGVGKKSIIQKVAYLIAEGKCPEPLKKFRILYVNIEKITEGEIEELQDFIVNKDIIFYVPDIENYPDFTKIFDNIVISTSEDEDEESPIQLDYQGYLVTNLNKSKHVEHFDYIYVEEPMHKEVIDMIELTVKELAESHNIKMNKKYIKYAVMYALCYGYNNGMNNPAKTIEFIDEAMAFAKINNMNEVTKRFLLESNSYFQDYLLIDRKVKKVTAYHEAGHYIVGKKLSKILKIELSALSIIPADEFNGVTLSDIDYKRIPYDDKRYYLSWIAYYLGGMMGELMYNDNVTAGGARDIENSFLVARNYVVKSTLSDKYICEKISSQKTIRKGEKAVLEFIYEGKEIAKSILKKNKKALKKIVTILLDKGIAIEEELKEIKIK